MDSLVLLLLEALSGALLVSYFFSLSLWAASSSSVQNIGVHINKLHSILLLSKVACLFCLFYHGEFSQTIVPPGCVLSTIGSHHWVGVHLHDFVMFTPEMPELLNFEYFQHRKFCTKVILYFETSSAGVAGVTEFGVIICYGICAQWHWANYCYYITWDFVWGFVARCGFLVWGAFWLWL